MKQLRFIFLGFFLTAVFAVQADVLHPPEKQKVNWPWVYPAMWKAGFGLQWQTVFLSDSLSSSVFAPGFQADIVLNKNFLIGPGLDFLRIPERDSVPAYNIWKPSLALGFMIPLDDYDIHHLILQVSPAVSITKLPASTLLAFGYSLAIQYEYTLFSNNILSPGIFYSRFPLPGEAASIGRWSLGFRYIFGK
jgi:hypothetical protein